MPGQSNWGSTKTDQREDVEVAEIKPDEVILSVIKAELLSME